MKNGALSTDAIVSFDPAISAELVYRTKRAGHVSSKMRFQSAQLIAYLDEHDDAEATKALAGAIEKALKQKEIRERFAAAGTDIYWSGPAEFDAFVKSELVKWTAAIKEAGIEPE